jgi:hypothetical protein
MGGAKAAPEGRRSAMTPREAPEALKAAHRRSGVWVNRGTHEEWERSGATDRAAMQDAYETPFDQYETPVDVDEAVSDLEARLDPLEAHMDGLEARVDRLERTMRRWMVFLGIVMAACSRRLIRRVSTAGATCMVITAPGCVRGNHSHTCGTEVVTVQGPALVRIRDEQGIQDTLIPEGEVIPIHHSARCGPCHPEFGDSAHAVGRLP